MRMHAMGARMNVAARQFEAAQSDLNRMTQLVQRHVNLKAPQSKTLLTLIDGLQQALKNQLLPGMTESFAALANLQTGR